MAKWMLHRKKADFKKLAEKYNIDPLIVMLIVNRGISSDTEINNYLNGKEDIFHDPYLMKDMDILISEIQKALQNDLHIRIIGDYDVDGVCASAILKKGIDVCKESLESNSFIDIVLPHRVKDGYGMNSTIIEKASNDGVDVIITCDNGISAVDEIKLANEKGIKVLITDHHEIPFSIDSDDEGVQRKKYIYPQAEAIVDPKREDSKYPFKEICGAFVAYKVIEALLQESYFQTIKKELMELSAIATVADIMELKDENRVLVKEGLLFLENPDNLGIRALIKELGLDGKKITSYHIGFMIGPSINASGRIESADYALELLLAKDVDKAQKLAAKLRDLNEQRKNYTEEAVEKAIIDIEENNRINDKIIVVYIPECHESVAGIVAGKLKNIYSKPSICITDSNDIAKGSCRSIEAYNMYEELTKVSYIFEKFGGHAMAAGFSLKKEKIDELREVLNCNCGLSDDECQEIIHIDADLPLSYINGKVMDEIEVLEPLGQGNPPCMFARKDVNIVSAKFFGENDMVGRYRVVDSDGKVSELTLFRKNNELRNYLVTKFGEECVNEAYAGNGEVSFSVAYYPKWNEYNGRKNIQLIIEDYC